jgi:hypothetical protein
MPPIATPFNESTAPTCANGAAPKVGRPVPAVARRRSGRRVSQVLAAVGVVAALAGCSVPSNTPTAYDDAVRANFVQGCTGDIPETNNTTTTLAAEDFCTCAYEVFVDQVPYNDDARAAFPNYPADAPTFTTFNDELSKSDTPDTVWDTLPQSVRDDLATCPLPPGPVAPDGASTTTTQASAETTTTAAG